MSKRLHFVLHLVTGALTVLAAWVIGNQLDLALHWFRWQLPLLGMGCLLMLLGALTTPTLLTLYSARFCLAWLSLLLALVALEIGFRLADFDFRQQLAWTNRMPPGWRQPRLPTGTVFFRREGPIVWTGQAERTHLDLIGLSSAAYASEPAITLRYDALGFRNEPRPSEWEIVVAGDSFTELTHVNSDELFTTVLGRKLGCRVLNLGVGSTGPLTQLSYLQDYGLSPATRQAVVVFFEGNDLPDLELERTAELRFEATGRRDYREFQHQTSFLRALGASLHKPKAPASPPNPRIDGYFVDQTGKTPVTFGHPPPGRKALHTTTLEALESFFSRYAAFGREHNIRTWLVYMPSKLRVLQGQIEFTQDAAKSLPGWIPSDLPEVIAEFCAQHAIEFFDLTPALIQHTRRDGELLYNHVYDCHLNGRGSLVVGETLAEALRAPSTTDPTNTAGATTN